MSHIHYSPVDTSYVIAVPASTVEATPYETSYGTLSAPASTITTSFVNFDKRADDNSSSSSSSRTRTRSSTTATKCDGDKQQCQTGSDMNGTTIGLAVAIPVAVFAAIIGYFLYRSYRKGKKEAETDNDPDFYGETTILPDYPKRNYDDFGNPTRISNGGSGQNDKSIIGDNQSYYSLNPFGNDNNTRYPSQVMNAPPSARLASNTGSYYENFPVPLQHHMGSKHSLDEFAKHSFGNEYSGYNVSRPASRATSRNDLNSVYRGGSPNSSSFNFAQQQHQRSLAENALSSEGPNTTESTVSHEKEIDSDFNTLAAPLATTGAANVFDDQHPVDPRISQQFHHRQNSDLSYVENEPEILGTVEQDDASFNTDFHNEAASLPSEGLKVTNPDDEEDDEDIQRMKSVYKVYFDRENSIKGHKQEDIDGEDVPPLPKLDESLAFNQPLTQTIVPEIVVEAPSNLERQNTHEFHEAQEYIVPGDDETPQSFEQQKESDHSALSTSLNPNVGNEKSHRAASSIYSTIPLNQFDQQTQQGAYNNHNDYQYQQQVYPHQPPQQQQQRYPQSQSQYQQYPGRIQMPVYNEPEAPKVPNPSKMDYDSVVTNTEYAPTKSLTGGSRPDLSIKPFNPLHYSDQIFQPTSPSTPTSATFEQLSGDAPNSNMRDTAAVPPSPHHIRQSIVMVNPVEIGKQKIFRPAGSYYQQQSANSSRNASITSQSMGFNQYPDSEEFPRSGSQADLRKHLGSSNNYNFV